MKAGFKCIMWAFIFSFSCLFMACKGSPVSVVVVVFFFNVSGEFWMQFDNSVQLS